LTLTKSWKEFVISSSQQNQYQQQHQQPPVFRSWVPL
jgi:hypothetical protein